MGLDQLAENYRHWKYKNTFLLVLSLVLLFYLADSHLFQNLSKTFENLGILGAFIAGIFFTSTFTVVPASIIIFYISQTMDPYWVTVLGGLGATLGDYAIFRFLKDRVFEELKPVFMSLGGSHLSRLFATPFFAWMAPVVGALIIASPLPDELGISLLSIAHLKNWQFVLISFVMNSFGIAMITILSKIL